ncbi:hypothetical protein ACWIID_46760, partial [Streptomyces phaeochromogenes]
VSPMAISHSVQYLRNTGVGNQTCIRQPRDLGSDTEKVAGMQLSFSSGVSEPAPPDGHGVWIGIV